MTQFFMGVKPGVGPVLKILKYDGDDALTLANTAYDRYYFNSENQDLGFLYKTLEYEWSKASMQSLPSPFFINGTQGTSWIVGSGGDAGGSESFGIALYYRQNNIVGFSNYPLLPELRQMDLSKGMYAAGNTELQFEYNTLVSIEYYQFNYLGVNVVGHSSSSPSPYEGILNNYLNNIGGSISVGEKIVTSEWNYRNSKRKHLLSFWSLPADQTPMPEYTLVPDKETLRLSPQGFVLSRPGHDVNETGFGVHIIDSNNSPALCVMSGEISNIGAGQSRVIPAPAGVTLATTAVVDFMYNMASDSEWSVPAKRASRSFLQHLNVFYTVQSNSITIINESSTAIKLRYVVFNADTRPQTSGGNEILREGNGFIQIKKPGSSDINPIPSDILVDTRYPSMQIIKQGYLPYSAFSSVSRGSDEHRDYGRHKATINFDNPGLLPYVKYCRVFQSAYAPPYMRMGIYNVGTYFSSQCPSSDSSLCILRNNSATFYLNNGEYTRFVATTNNSGQPVIETRRDARMDPIGIRYYIFGITQ